MNKQTKAMVYNLIGFAIIFFPVRYLVLEPYLINYLLKPLIAFAIATLIAPKFQAVKTHEGEKIFMKWFFFKGVKEVK